MNCVSKMKGRYDQYNRREQYVYMVRITGTIHILVRIHGTNHRYDSYTGTYTWYESQVRFIYWYVYMVRITGTIHILVRIYMVRITGTIHILVRIYMVRSTRIMHKIGTKWVNSHLFGTMLVFIGNEFKKKTNQL